MATKSIRHGADPENHICASLVQAEFDKLQEGYRALKAQKLAEVNKVMEGLSKKTEGHVKTAARLTEHWKAEAMRQAEFAPAASDMPVGGLPRLVRGLGVCATCCA